MHGATRDFDAVVVGIADAVCTLKTWQQARVQVDDFAFEGIDKCWAENTHEPCENNELRAKRANALNIHSVRFGTEARASAAGVLIDGRHGVLLAKVENARIGDITDERGHFSTPQIMRRLGFEQRFRIGTASGAENDDRVSHG